MTLQGEGCHAGRAAVFLRFSGCNLWSGREADRATAACRFCDTDFVGIDGVGGGSYDCPSLVAAAERAWSGGTAGRFIVCTGGEPLLQLDPPLVAALQAAGFQVAVETNGTRTGIGNTVDLLDWVCVSPKADAGLERWTLRRGHELKLVYPQPGLMPDDVAPLAGGFDHWLLQPMDGPQQAEHTAAAVVAVQTDPRWRLSVQTHKVIGIA